MWTLSLPLSTSEHGYMVVSSHKKYALTVILLISVTSSTDSPLELPVLVPSKIEDKRVVTLDRLLNSRGQKGKWEGEI